MFNILIRVEININHRFFHVGDYPCLILTLFRLLSIGSSTTRNSEMSYKLLFVVLVAFAPINHCNNEKLFLQSHRDQILAKLLYKYGIPEEHKSYQEQISETVGKIDVDAATPLDMKRNTGNVLHKDPIS